MNYTTEEVANRPLLHGEHQNASNYSSFLIQGFEETYTLIMKNKTGFISETVQDYSRSQFRQVFRPSQVYGRFLEASTRPDYLQAEADRRRLLHMMTEAKDSLHTGVIRQEIRQLDSNDIPYFGFSLLGKDVFTSDGSVIPDVFHSTVIENVESKLASLSSEDLAMQVRFIRWSLASLDENAWVLENTKPPLTTEIVANMEFTSMKHRMHVVREIADYLCNSALTSKGELTWIGLRLFGERVKPSIKEESLYDGVLGYVIFLAQASNICDETRYGDVARLAMKTIITKVKDDGPEVPSVSAFYGETAIVYTMVYCGLLWHDEELLVVAKSRLSFINDELSKESAAIDIIDGYAGCLLVLLRVYDMLQDADYLSAARVCGEKLVSEVHDILDRGDMTLLTGYSHGASGIALALTKLGAAVQDNAEYFDLVHALLQYENQHFDVKLQNWLDLRGNIETNLPGSGVCDFWCHGSSGIALARSEIYQLLQSSDVHMDRWNFVLDDLARATASVRLHAAQDNHSLCHGTLGNVDILLTLAEATSDHSLRELALRLTAYVLEQKDKSGWVGGLTRSAEMHGLMLGLSGYGYAILRTIDERVPSILNHSLPKQHR
jgi:type 2 lantibiotic biosynthesis protein LanM